MARIIERSKHYIIPNSYEHAVKLLQKFTACAIRNKMYAMDTETGGLCWYRDAVYMVSLYTAGIKAVVLPVGWEDSALSVKDLKALLQELVNLQNITCFLFNAKFDMHFLANCAVMFKNQIVDVRVIGFMINNTLPANLKGRAKVELGVEPKEFKKLFDLKRGKILLDYPVEDVAPYAANDAIWTYQLGKKFVSTGFSLDKNSEFSVGEDPELTQMYKKIDHKLTLILFDMEREGVLISRKRIEIYKDRIKPILKDIEKRAINKVGAGFNLRSVKQLREIFRRRGISLESTDVEHLEEAYKETKDPLIELILKHRKISKTLGTYADGLLEVLDANSFVHTDFDQVGAKSGRLSSSDPNLQNIQRDDEIRCFFRPRPDHVFIVRDFGQIELRVAAHVANDHTMIEEFKSGMDIHSLGASVIFNKDIKDITPEERQASKATTSFGVLFDMSPYSLAQKLEVSEDKAEVFIYNWFKKYHGIDKFFKRLQASALQVGYVRSFLGRLRYEENLKSSERRKVSAALRSVRNTVIQGPAADLVKLAMIEISEDEELRSWGYRMLIQVHDK